MCRECNSRRQREWQAIRKSLQGIDNFSLYLIGALTPTSGIRFDSASASTLEKALGERRLPGTCRKFPSSSDLISASNGNRTSIRAGLDISKGIYKKVKENRVNSNSLLHTTFSLKNCNIHKSYIFKWQSPGERKTYPTDCASQHVIHQINVQETGTKLVGQKLPTQTRYRKSKPSVLSFLLQIAGRLLVISTTQTQLSFP